MDTQKNSILKIIIGILLIVVLPMVLGGFVGYHMTAPAQPREKAVIEKCIDGKRTATNDKNYHKVLKDENNIPLRCQ